MRRPAPELGLAAVPCVPAARQQLDVALLPNLLVPGASHSGAGLLTADLARHPQVCPPDDRCPGLFHDLRYGRPVDVRPHDYDRHYAGWAGQRYRMETSPDYLDGGLPMARTLAERLPGLRVVVVLRDPALRLWTGYTDQLARRRLPRAMAFDAFVDRCLALRSNGADRFEGNRHFRTLSSGYYVDSLPHWFDIFGDRLRVVFTEDLREEPAAQLAALLAWLDLDPGQSPGSVGGAQAAGEPEPAGSPRRLWPVLPRSGAWRAAGAGGRVPRQTDRARARVRSLYAGANAELADLLRARGFEALPGWLAEPGT